MGNCVATNKILSENDEKQQQQQQQFQPSVSTTTTKVSDAKQDEEEEEGRAKRKMVTFKLSDDRSKVDKRGPEGRNSGAVRIRVVVTKEELRQILKHRKDLKCNSLEQLVNTLKLRERRINEGSSSDHKGGSWKPALESIPEDH